MVFIMQSFGVALFFVVSTIASAELPLKVHKSLKIENFEGFPLDPSWMQGKSRLLDIEKSTFDKTPTYYEGVPACQATYSCMDCNIARLCHREANGIYTDLATVKCPPELPFCDFATGTCTNLTNSTCGVYEPTFPCTKDGYFPDPSNSLVYHVCKNQVSHKFECTVPGEMFNAVSRSCTPSEAFVTFNCNQMGSKVPYRLDNNYFGYCNNRDHPPLIVDKCPGNTKLNTTSQKCEVFCETAGVHADVEDCTKYYRCESISVDSNNILIKSLKDCPSGTSFSYIDNMCIESSSNNYCATNLE